MLAAGLVAAVTAGSKPNFLYVLVDDYGWADAGWHRPAGYQDIRTPRFDELIKEGVELDRHYVFKFCSPTRSAVQSGRNPLHVNVLNLDPTVHNAKDPVSGYAAVPRNMTGMAEVMSRAGYVTHMYGKWDAGMATPQHTPHGRGYQHSLFYFHHANDYWTSSVGSCTVEKKKELVIDLWNGTAPAHGQNNSRKCSQEAQEDCIYEDALFAEKVYDAIRTHDVSKPLFVFWAPHIVHQPLQVPDNFLARFSDIDDKPRRLYHSMVGFVDEAVGNATDLLRARGMWDNTLMVLHADNGGPIYNSGDAGANNHPLKGGKMSNWEGGVRVNAFASGGLLPAKVRGTKQEGYVCGWDWYATFAGLAGEDPTDHRAAAAGLPPIDGMDMWPLLSGATTESPRTEIALGDSMRAGKTKVGGLIQGRYKILLGTNTMAGWTGAVFPNTTVHWNPSTASETCGNTTADGCLFDIIADPTEHENIIAKHPDIFQRLVARAAELQKEVFSPERGQDDPEACKLAMGKYGGFWGPFVDV